MRVRRWDRPARRRPSPLQQEQQQPARTPQQHTEAPKPPGRPASQAAASRHPSAMGNTKSSSGKRVRTWWGPRRRLLSLAGRLERGGVLWVGVAGLGAGGAGVRACTREDQAIDQCGGAESGDYAGVPKGFKGSRMHGFVVVYGWGMAK